MNTTWFLWAAIAAAAPSEPDPGEQAGWLEVVARSTSPTSARWTGPEAAPFWEKACAAGREAACIVRDGATVADGLAETCPIDESGQIAEDADPVACLGRYWSWEALEPEKAFDGYDALCEAGLPRACAEVARAHAEGIGTFRSNRRARQQAEALCADGIGAACVVVGRLDVANRPRRAGGHFDQAIELGEIGAIWEKVPVVVMVEAADRLTQEGCDVGHPGACLSLAEDIAFDDPEASQVLSQRACDLGSAEGCLRDALSKHENGTITKTELGHRLDSLCLVLEDACTFAGFLGFGGDVVSFFPGRYPDTELQRITGQIFPFARDCFRDFRERHPDAERELDLGLTMWVDLEGVVRGVVPLTEGDEEYKQCVAEKALGVVTKHLPEGGPALITDDMAFGMEADIVVYTFKGASGSKQVEDLETLAYEEWTGEANACYMDNGGSAWDDVFTWVYGEIMRDGSFVGTRLIESSGDEPTDACILEMLQGIDLGETYTYNERVRIYIRFNIVYRVPRERGRNHGKAADPDTYMYGPDNIPPDTSF